jgi:DNA polymerase-1
MHRELDNQTSGEIGVDIETVSLEDRTPLCIAISPNKDEAFYYPIDSAYLPWHILNNPNVVKIFHNGHFDLSVLYTYRGISIPNVKDTIIAAQLLGLPPALAPLAYELLNAKWESIEDLIGKGKNALSMRDVPEEKMAQKCANDARHTLGVWQILKDSVPQQAFELEMQLMPVLMDIEQRGMRINIEQLLKHRERISKKVNYYKGIAESYGFNPGSSLQLAKILQDRGHLVPYNHKTGKPKLGAQILSTQFTNEPLAKLVLLYRSAKILLSTFIDAILEKHLVKDRVYSRVNQNVARSGRLSRSKPNLQNIPPTMRDIYVASNDCYLESWDLNQIELRILAWLVWQHTGDYSMQSLFDQGGDFHTSVQRKLNIPERRITKNLNFSIIYGGDAHTLHTRYGVALDTASQQISDYFTAFPGVRVYIDKIHTQLLQTGYTETLLGRRRGFKDMLSSSWAKDIAKAKREGFNHVIQGSAGEILKRWQVKAKAEPQINTIHDEILLDIPYNYAVRNDYHLDLAKHETPITTKRGQDWLNMIEV